MTQEGCFNGLTVKYELFIESNYCLHLFLLKQLSLKNPFFFKDCQLTLLALQLWLTTLFRWLAHIWCNEKN